MPITAAERILELRQQLNEHSFRYYVLGSPLVSDQDYDGLFKELKQLETAHPEMADPNSPTMRIGSPLPTGMAKIKHKTRMLSLDNLENTKQVMQFFNAFAGEEATIEMKIDGLSLHLHYEAGKLIQAITRGNGMEGEDVTENARAVRTIPLELRKPISIDVRGEVFWRLSKFVDYNAQVAEGDRYANPRNAASGIMRQRDSRQVARCGLDFIAYAVPADLPPSVINQEDMLSYLESLGFRSTMTLDITKDMAGLPYVTTVIDPEEMPLAIQFLDNYRMALDMDTDGLVIKVSSLALQRDAGEGERSPKWAAAYKFPPEAKETKLLGVTIQVGKTGQITPVAELEPIALGGTVVQRASLCNQDELIRLGIDIGDFVFVQRSGEVIPKVIGLARPSSTKGDPNKVYRLPKTCPCCSTALTRPEGKVHFYCPNLDCYDQVFARLVYSVSKDALDIDGCGEVGVKMLMKSANVRRLSDLFHLKDFSFFKPAQRKKIQEGLEKAKTAPLWRKIAALNIEGIGKVSAQDLATKFQNIAGMCDPETLKPVLGEVATESFLNWLDIHISELETLSALGFTFVEDKKATGPLSGKTFCITGTLMSGGRNDVSAIVEHYGGVIKGSVTRKVDYLVQGADGGQGKASDAVKWGTIKISEEELYRMIGIPMPIGRNVPENFEP